VQGEDLTELNNEQGGHRVQRVPPTERKGRVHSSTVTVAVLDPLEPTHVTFNDADFRIEWFSGTGNGGQNKNKVQACCRLIHIETGLTQTAQTRSRENSYKLARERMIAALERIYVGKQNAVRATDRKNQVGSGMRSDKTRTYRFQDDTVVDHTTGKRAPLTKIMRGGFDLVW
jgi:peptide chain release factor 1